MTPISCTLSTLEYPVRSFSTFEHSVILSEGARALASTTAEEPRRSPHHLDRSILSHLDLPALSRSTRCRYRH
jgi:hypothetical protein